MRTTPERGVTYEQYRMMRDLAIKRSEGARFRRTVKDMLIAFTVTLALATVFDFGMIASVLSGTAAVLLHSMISNPNEEIAHTEARAKEVVLWLDLEYPHHALTLYEETWGEPPREQIIRIKDD